MVEGKGYAEFEMPPELWQATLAVQALFEKFRNRRDERRARNQVPEVLYHYTNLTGLHGMLSNFMIWLSDAALMNDPLEGTWVHYRASTLTSQILGDTLLGRRTLEQVEAQLSAPDLWDLTLRGTGHSALHSAAMTNAFRPAFIASFTEEGDLLSQWRGYGSGGDGVSIGFDLNELGPCEIVDLPGEQTRAIVLTIEYDEARQDDEISWILNSAKHVYSQHIEALKITRDAELFFTQRFYTPIDDAFYWLRWEFKSPHYAEEKEWRLVAHPHGPALRKTRVANGHIIPYVEMPLPQTIAKPINRLAIPRIVLGPRCQPTALRGIRVLLQNLAYPEIVRSRLALR